MSNIDFNDLQGATDDLRSAFERLYAATGQQSKASKNVFDDLTIETSLRRKHNEALKKAEEIAEKEKVGKEQLVKTAKELGSGMFSATQSMYSASGAFEAVVPVIDLMANTTKSLVEAFGLLASGVTVAGFGVGRFSESLAKFVTTGIDVVSAAVKQQIQNTQILVNDLNSLSKVGVTFGGSLSSMQKAAAAGAISVDTFTKFVTKNAEVLTNLGGSAELGAVKIASMGKEIGRQNNQLLAMYGGYEQINEGIAQYADTLAGYGISGTRLNKELESGARNYLYQQKELSELTGKSVESLKKQEEERQRVAAFQNVMATKSVEEQANIRMALAIAEKTAGERGAKYLMESVITNGNVISKSGLEFQAVAGPMANTFEQLRQSTNMTTDAYKTQAASIIKNNAATNQAWAKSNQTTTFSTLQFAGYQNDIFSMVNDVASAVNRSAEWQTKITDADIQQQENRKKGAKGEADIIAGAINSLEDFKIRMDDITIKHLGNTETYLKLAYSAAELLSKGLGKTNDAVSLLTKMINGTVKKADYEKFKSIMGFGGDETASGGASNGSDREIQESKEYKDWLESQGKSPRWTGRYDPKYGVDAYKKAMGKQSAGSAAPATPSTPMATPPSENLERKPTAEEVAANQKLDAAETELRQSRAAIAKYAKENPILATEDHHFVAVEEQLVELINVTKDNRDLLEKLFHASV